MSSPEWEATTERMVMISKRLGPKYLQKWAAETAHAIPWTTEFINYLNQSSGAWLQNKVRTKDQQVRNATSDGEKWSEEVDGFDGFQDWDLESGIAIKYYVCVLIIGWEGAGIAVLN